MSRWTFLMENEDRLAFYRDRHEKVLSQVLENSKIPAIRLKEAMHYALFSGGKRIRPLLVYLCGEMLEIRIECLDIIAASIECIHSYSLVHDDLPAMDNDDFRRGRPSCHRAFDEATAILAGDALQALAMDLILSQLVSFLPEKSVVTIALELVKASGPSGMVSGQSLDMTELENQELQEPRLKTIHTLKTGRLIRACMNTVLCTGHFETKSVDALQDFAEHLGLVFQMQDDYLDAYANIHDLGKKRSSDMINQKITYASFYTKDALKQLIDEHYGLAINALRVFEGREGQLLKLVDSLQKRE